MNAWVEQYLRLWVNQQEQDDWVMYLPIAEFAHNSWPHNISKKIPHKLLFGFNPTVDVTPSGVNNSPLATDRLLALQQARLHAAEVLKHRYVS